GNSSETTVTLENAGAAGLDITSVSVTGADPAAFSVSGLTTGTVPGETTESFTVTTSPSVTGSVSAQLVVETAQQGTLTATLGATGVEPDIQIQRGSLTFDQTRIGETDTATLRIRNTGNAELNVNSLALAGANPDEFSLDRSSVTIPAKTTREVTVTFEPS
ncbi:choice-of-anchor D domain-containing protein, partial [Haloferax sp. Atlit-6N]